MKKTRASTLEVRINQLQKRDPVTNEKIIKKLKRQLRAIQTN